jgi:predicted nuclease of restriction endonuclease-like RecB superfamily
VTATNVRLYDERDAAWIGHVVDHAVAVQGQPWRVLRERLEHAPIGAPRVAAILGALRRVIGGRADRTRIARKVRGLVLGPPALDAASREARLATAGEQLGLDADGVRDLLWIDLANERPVTLPYGRPSELRLAAFANLDRIQRAVRKARAVRLRVDGDAGELVRMAARCGLIATVTAHGDTTQLDLVGPLALFHDTAVYGRAIAALVPLLAAHASFELLLEHDLGDTIGSFRIASPALLPPYEPRPRTPSAAQRLARRLAKHGIETALDPPVLAHGTSLLYPDLAITLAGRRWLVELVGFATADYLAAKLARYRDAGITDIVLCIEQRRAPSPLPAGCIVTYTGKLDGDRLVGFLEEAP